MNSISHTTDIADSTRTTPTAHTTHAALTVYLCDNTLDGILSAIYLAWEDGTSHTDVRVKHFNNYSLFEEYKECTTDSELAQKVRSSILRKLSFEFYYYIYCACMSNDEEKASYAYKLLQKGFRYGTGILNNLNDPVVFKVFRLKRTVSSEACRYREFIRFEELDNGILCGRIAPDNNIITMIADHFADRFPLENWIILDTKRNLSLVHPAGSGYILTENITEDSLFGKHSLSEKEQSYQALWKRFFDTTAIEERINPALQRTLMPLKCRTYLHECR